MKKPAVRFAVGQPSTPCPGCRSRSDADRGRASPTRGSRQPGARRLTDQPRDRPRPKVGVRVQGSPAIACSFSRVGEIRARRVDKGTPPRTKRLGAQPRGSTAASAPSPARLPAEGAPAPIGSRPANVAPGPRARRVERATRSNTAPSRPAPCAASPTSTFTFVLARQGRRAVSRAAPRARTRVSPRPASTSAAALPSNSPARWVVLPPGRRAQVEDPVAPAKRAGERPARRASPRRELARRNAPRAPRRVDGVAASERTV